jgi:fructose-specific component phosphotransferase system IIB-like protein
MTRTHICALVALAVVMPAAAATSYFVTNPAPKPPCLLAGEAAYRVTGSATADYIVRIDNADESAALRMQMVDDPAEADFVLVDDSVATDACPDASAIKTIRIDGAAAAPDVTVSVSRAPAGHKIYVKSASFSEQDAAALFAVIWKDARHAALGREVASRP